MKRNLIYLFILVIYNVYGQRSLNLKIDNDIFFSDQFYTSGIELELETRDSNFYNVEKELADDNEKNRLQYVTRRFIGQKLYTPSNIRLTLEEKEKYERPYAGFLYAGYSMEKYSSNSNYIIHSYTIGATGDISLGEFYQKEYHELIGSPEPQGWDMQIEDKFIFQYNLEYSPKNHLLFSDDKFSSDYRNIFKVNLGNLQLGGSLGFLIRYGNILSDFSSKKTNFEKSPTENFLNLKEYYIFFNGNIKTTLHDTTYEGTLISNHSPLTVDINPIVLEERLGIILTWEHFLFEYILNVQSTEVKNEKWRLDWHLYHSFNFKYLY